MDIRRISLENTYKLFIRLQIGEFFYIFTPKSIHTHIVKCTYVHLYIHICVYIHFYIYFMYFSVYVSMCVCVYIFPHIYFIFTFDIFLLYI